LYYLPDESPPGDVVIYLGLTKAEDGYISSGRILCLNYGSKSHRISFPNTDSAAEVVDTQSGVSLIGFTAEELQQQPKVSVNIQQVKQKTTEKQLNFRIRRKHLIKNHFYYAEMNLYLCPLAAYSPEKSVKQEDLRNYAAQLEQSSPSVDQISAHNPTELSEFNTKLDLHAHQILDNPRDYRGDEIFMKQIEAFERYMDRAIRLGVDRIEIVHGIGTGRLRETLSQRLNQYKEVKRFENGFTTDHKFGATVVYFS
jgi:hypothetical protein